MGKKLSIVLLTYFIFLCQSLLASAEQHLLRIVSNSSKDRIFLSTFSKSCKVGYSLFPALYLISNRKCSVASFVEATTITEEKTNNISFLPWNTRNESESVLSSLRSFVGLIGLSFHLGSLLISPLIL